MNKIEFGDCRDTMRRWASEGVKAQMCVTSPPYFGLRSYMPDAVKLRGDIDPEEMASALKELERLGVQPCAHTTE
jgi:DNA modification methylase